MGESPSVDNYFIGTGILRFDRFDEAGLPQGFRDLGNAPVFSLGATVELKEHEGSRGNMKEVDFQIPIKKSSQGKFTLDEFSIPNLAMGLFGVVDGVDVIRGLQSAKVEGELEFTGQNEVGRRFLIRIWRASITPAKEIDFISAGSDFGAMEFAFICQKDLSHVGNEYFEITELGES